MERLKPVRIAVFVPNWVGDAVMATPAMAALRRRFPESHIVALARPYVRDVLNGAEFLDEVRGLDSLKNGAPVMALLADARVLKRERFDLAVLMTNSFRTAIFAWLSGARERLGYARDGRGFVLTMRVTAKKEAGRYQPAPMIDYYVRLVAEAGAASGDRTMRLAVTDEEAKAADQILEEFEVDESKPLAVVNPGAAFGSAKCWPAENFAAVADALGEKGFEVLVETSPKEREIGEAIAANASRRLKRVWRSSIPLGTLKALVAKATVLITNDSGPRHIGAALGVPVVTIMGPTDPRWSETGYAREVVLRRDVECAPCMLRTCPTDHKCMTLITPQDVVEAVEKVLGGAQPQEAGVT